MRRNVQCGGAVRWRAAPSRGGQQHVAEETAAYQSLFPRPPLRGFIIGRAFIDGQPVHVEDVETDQTITPGRWRSWKRGAPYRTYLGIPIIRDGVPIGAIGCGRREVKPFTATQIELVKTFADQAVIAIENVRLFAELESRNSELRVALDQQTATSEVLKVISRSTFDLKPVLETLVENAARLAGAVGALLARFDGEVFRFVAEYGASPRVRRILAPKRDRPWTRIGDRPGRPRTPDDPYRRRPGGSLSGRSTRPSESATTDPCSASPCSARTTWSECSSCGEPK